MENLLKKTRLTFQMRTNVSVNKDKKKKKKKKK